MSGKECGKYLYTLHLEKGENVQQMLKVVVFICVCAHMYFPVFSNILYNQCVLFLEIDKNIYAFRN